MSSLTNMNKKITEVKDYKTGHQIHSPKYYINNYIYEPIKHNLKKNEKK